VHFRIAFGSAHQHSDSMHRLAGLRHGNPRACDSRTTEQCDKLAPFQMIELHSVPASQAGLQDTELAMVSQGGMRAFAQDAGPYPGQSLPPRRG
jgi:hypothetical protein